MFFNFNDKIKIKYIECWLNAKNCSVSQVATFLNIDISFLSLIITEYENQNGHIIVESKLNKI